MINEKTKFAVIGLGVLGGSYVQALSRKGYACIGVDIDEAPEPEKKKSISQETNDLVKKELLGL